MAQNQSPRRDTPEVMRRRLRVALRQEREAAGLTQREAAEALDWSVSKILRVEQGAVAITPIDLRALLAVYKTVDEKREAELVELARGSRKQSWSEFRDVYTPAALTLFGYEAAAKVIYKYEPTFIPGLLQTEEYARALLKGLGYSEGQIDLMVRARLERQELLDREPRPKLQFILGEACLSRPVGGTRVMTHQLDRLKSMAARPDISLQILPFSAGAHPRMGEAFTILQFADENLDDLLYLENAGGESVSQENPEVIARYFQDFFTLQSMANDSASFVNTIDNIEETRLVSSASVAPNGEERPLS